MKSIFLLNDTLFYFFDGETKNTKSINKKWMHEIDFIPNRNDSQHNAFAWN